MLSNCGTNSSSFNCCGNYKAEGQFLNTKPRLDRERQLIVLSTITEVAMRELNFASLRSRLNTY